VGCGLSRMPSTFSFSMDTGDFMTFSSTREAETTTSDVVMDCSSSVIVKSSVAWLTAISCALNPIEDTTTVKGGGSLMRKVNRPSELVVVPTTLPFTWMLTPIRGVADASVTVPERTVWPNVVEKLNGSTNSKTNHPIGFEVIGLFIW